MRYTPRSRDRYKALLAVLTGLATFGSVTATGAATGWAARQTGLRDQARAEDQAFRSAQARAAAARAVQWQPRARTIHLLRTRPQRTVVVTRAVHAVSGSGVAAVGGGGTVSAPASSTSVQSSSAGGTTSTSSSSGGSAPAPAPVPAPAPAPSSGS